MRVLCGGGGGSSCLRQKCPSSLAQAAREAACAGQRAMQCSCCAVASGVLDSAGRGVTCSWNVRRLAVMYGLSWLGCENEHTRGYTGKRI